MIKLTNLGLLMILPLFTVALVASYNSPAYGGGHGVGMPTQGEILCLPSEVAIKRTTNPQIICVDKTTATKWVGYGMATIGPWRNLWKNQKVLYNNDWMK